MVLVHLSAALQKLRPFKAPMIVVAVSALLALLFTLATMPSASEPPRAAGEAAMQLMSAEHDLAAASIRQILAALAEEDARSRADIEVASAETAAPAPPAMPAIAVKPLKAAQAVPLPKASPVTAPPLPLQAVASAQPERQRPLVMRARAVLGTVEQIPHWLRAGAENVADWAVMTPVETIARLPERRFL